MARLLIVDDEPLFRTELRLALENAGYVVDEAADGREALDVMRKGRPDLVITDILMPHVDGVETMRNVKTLYPGTKVIAVSDGGYSRAPSYLAWARKLGADAIYAKPFELAALLERVASLLGNSHGAARPTDNGGGAFSRH